VILLSRGSFDEKDPAIFSSWCRSTIRSMRTACQLVHDLSKRKASGQAFRRVGTMASRLIEGVAPDRADALTSGVIAWVSSGVSGARTCACIHDTSSFSEIRTIHRKTDYRPSDRTMSNYAEATCHGRFRTAKPNNKPKRRRD
jgi:hypothetical protein